MILLFGIKSYVFLNIDENLQYYLSKAMEETEDFIQKCS